MNFLTCSAPWAKCSKDAGWRAPRSGLVYLIHISCSSRTFDNFCISSGSRLCEDTGGTRGIAGQRPGDGIRYLVSGIQYPASGDIAGQSPGDGIRYLVSRIRYPASWGYRWPETRRWHPVSGIPLSHIPPRSRILQHNK